MEKWCQDHFLSCAALRTADVVRAELLEIIKRIELPYAEPAFGSRENTLNLKKALLSGYFMQVRMAETSVAGSRQTSRVHVVMPGIWQSDKRKPCAIKDIVCK